MIERCLEKDPALRYQSSDEVRASLETVQAGVTLKVWLAWKYGLSRGRWLAVAAAVVAVVAVLGALDVGGARSRLLSMLEGQKYHSLPVLPVANLSGDPAQEYFGDGMTDTLIAEVSKIGALRVMSRTSVIRYKGTKKSLPEIARDLKVDTVLETSVAREAGRVRLTAQLIEAASDRHLLAETYERELAGILWVQSEVARAVARTVRARLTPQQETRLAGKREVNPAAYEAYLRGISYLHQSTPEGNQKGMASLLEALEKDPADPMVNAQLAFGYITLAHGAAPPEDALPRARAAVRTALELDSNLAEGLAASGFVKGYDRWDWEGGVVAHCVLGLVHQDRGRYEEAIAEIQKSTAINPTWKWALGPTYALAGRTAEARGVVAELKQQKIDRWQAFWLAYTRAALGERDEAFRWLNIKNPHVWVPWLLTEGWIGMKPIRDDPRFRELQVRMNVPQ